MQDVFEIKNCSDFGRYLVAKKNFKSGELIFAESPIVAFPDNSCFQDLKRKLYTCLGCFRVIKPIEAIRCSRCKWPACSERCANDETHIKLECRLLQSSEIKWTSKVISYAHILRSLVIRYQDPIKWSQILSLTSKREWKDRDSRSIENKRILHLQHFLKKHLNMNVNSKLLKRLDYIFIINSFGYSNINNRFGYGMIFATSSLIAHSCSPNLEWTIPKSFDECEGKWDIRLYCRRDIKVGELVTIAYSSDYLSLGTLERRHCMMDHFSFFCQCERCRTPSELGFNYSAVQCPKCQVGWVHPHCAWESKNFSMTHEYKCDDCQNAHSEDAIWNFEERFDSQLAEIINQNSSFQGSCEKLLDSLISNATPLYHLHPNHHLVTQAILHWVSVHDFKILLESTDEASLEFEKIMERSERCRIVFKYLGNASDYAKMEACVATAMCLYHFKSEDYLSIQNTIVPLPEKLRLLKKIVQHMTEGIQLVQGLRYNLHADKLVEILKVRFVEWKQHLVKCEDSLSNQSSQNVISLGV